MSRFPWIVPSPLLRAVRGGWILARAHFGLALAVSIGFLPTVSLADDWCPGFGPYGFDGEILQAATFGSDLVVTGLISANGSTPCEYVARWNGSQWLAMANPGLTASIFSITSVCEYDGDLYLGSFHGLGTAVLMKWNGTDWDIVDQSIGDPFVGQITSMLPYDGMLVLAGHFTGTQGQSFGGSVVGWNGVDWVTLGDPPDNVDFFPTDLVEYDGDLYVTGKFGEAGGVPAHSLARWNGTQWTPVEGLANGTWEEGLYGNMGRGYALAVHDGKLVVGGSFDHAGALACSNLVAWDAATQEWQSLGNADATVLSLAESGADLFAGGEFTDIDGVPVSHGARFDGVAWNPLDVGVSGPVNTILPYGGDVVLGGDFLDAGGERHPYLAIWDGASFSGLDNPGLGTEGSVAAMVEYDGKLIVGGELTNAGSSTVNRLAAWLGSGWEPFGGGAGSPIRSLYADGSDLYVGGDFTSIGGGGGFSYLARWNGGSWENLGGAPQPVDAWTQHAGQIYAGGYHFLQKWTGSSWQTVPLSFGNEEIFALSSFDNKLVAGGNILRSYDGNQWADIEGGSSPSGVDGDVHCFAAWNGWLYVGGSFGYAAGERANGLARWDGNTLESMGRNVPLQEVHGMAVIDDVLYVTGYGGKQTAWLEAGATEWSTVDHGWASGVGQAIVEYQGDVYAAGVFLEATDGSVMHNFVKLCASPTAVRGPLPARSLNWSVSPSPFNPRLTIRFEVPGTPEFVTVRILDVRGRLVRQLVDGARAPGAHVISWDGRDEQGRDVASGVYIVQLQLGPSAETRKAVLVR